MWDRRQIARAAALLERAAAHQRIRPYRLEAAIAAVSGEAPARKATDWPQLLELCSLLTTVDRPPVVLRNRAVVLGQVQGPAVVLAQIEQLSTTLDHYYPWHAARASLLRQLDRGVEADEADAEALRHTGNRAERALIKERSAAGGGLTPLDGRGRLVPGEAH